MGFFRSLVVAAQQWQLPMPFGPVMKRLRKFFFTIGTRCQSRLSWIQFSIPVRFYDERNLHVWICWSTTTTPLTMILNPKCPRQDVVLEPKMLECETYLYGYLRPATHKIMSKANMTWQRHIETSLNEMLIPSIPKRP